MNELPMAGLSRTVEAPRNRSACSAKAASSSVRRWRRCDRGDRPGSVAAGLAPASRRRDHRKHETDQSTRSHAWVVTHSVGPGAPWFVCLPVRLIKRESNPVQFPSDCAS
jgi:hypothetical protein